MISEKGKDGLQFLKIADVVDHRDFNLFQVPSIDPLVQLGSEVIIVSAAHIHFNEVFFFHESVDMGSYLLPFLYCLEDFSSTDIRLNLTARVFASTIPFFLKTETSFDPSGSIKKVEGLNLGR